MQAITRQLAPRLFLLALALALFPKCILAQPEETDPKKLEFQDIITAMPMRDGTDARRREAGHRRLSAEG